MPVPMSAGARLRAALANERVENIGARRLQTAMAQLMEDLLFDLPDPSRKTIRTGTLKAARCSATCAFRLGSETSAPGRS